jgi:hypothetical protein
MASRTVSKDIITLRGSAAIVSEFFGTRPATLPPLISFILCAGEMSNGILCIVGYAANRYTTHTARSVGGGADSPGGGGLISLNKLILVVLQHPVQPRGVFGGELHQGEEVRAHDAAHAGRGGQDLHRQHHLPALRSPPTLRSPITPSPQLDCLEVEMCPAFLTGAVCLNL